MPNANFSISHQPGTDFYLATQFSMKCVVEHDSILNRKKRPLIAILAFLVWVLWLASYRAAQNDNRGVGNEPQRNPEQRSVVDPEKCLIDAVNQASKQAMVQELRSI